MKFTSAVFLCVFSVFSTGSLQAQSENKEWQSRFGVGLGFQDGSAASSATDQLIPILTFDQAIKPILAFRMPFTLIFDKSGDLNVSLRASGGLLVHSLRPLSQLPFETYLFGGVGVAVSQSRGGESSTNLMFEGKFGICRALTETVTLDLGVDLAMIQGDDGNGASSPTITTLGVSILLPFK